MCEKSECSEKEFNFGESKTVIKTIKKIFILSFMVTAAAAYAQVVPATKGGESTLWVGGEYARFAPDYGAGDLNGAGALFDLNVTPKIGVIGEFRWLHWSPSEDVGETQSDYLGGVKYRLFKWYRLSGDAKFVLGGVWIRFPDDIGSGSYFAFAPGGTLNYRLSRRFLVRGDYEYQFLPSAPNIPGQPNNGLQPRGFSVGVMYNLIR